MLGEVLECVFPPQFAAVLLIKDPSAGYEFRIKIYRWEELYFCIGGKWRCSSDGFWSLTAWLIRTLCSHWIDRIDSGFLRYIQFQWIIIWPFQKDLIGPLVDLDYMYVLYVCGQSRVDWYGCDQKKLRIKRNMEIIRGVYFSLSL